MVLNLLNITGNLRHFNLLIISFGVLVAYIRHFVVSIIDLFYSLYLIISICRVLQTNILFTVLTFSVYVDRKTFKTPLAGNARASHSLLFRRFVELGHRRDKVVTMWLKLLMTSSMADIMLVQCTVHGYPRDTRDRRAPWWLGLLPIPGDFCEVMANRVVILEFVSNRLSLTSTPHRVHTL